MKSLKMITLALVSTLALSLGLASSNELSNSNTPFDYVYTTNGIGGTEIVGSVLSDADGRTLTPFTAGRTEEQSLYLGMKTPFDRVVFNVEDAVVTEEGVTSGLAWEYYNGHAWKPLPVWGSASHLDVVGVHTIDFNAPWDWISTEMEFRQEAYWIRLHNVSELQSGGLIDQAGARAYNIELQLLNEFGDGVSNLEKADFHLYHGTDNTIYGLESRGKGVYWLSLQSKAEDTQYMLTVDAPGYLDKGINLEPNPYRIAHYTSTMTFDGVCLLPFNDIEFTWMKPAVRDLYCRGVVDLSENGSFNASQALSRGEFLDMMLENGNIKTDEPVAYALKKGWIDEAFAADLSAPVSRGEGVVAFLNSVGLVSTATESHFTDLDAELIPYVNLAYRYSLIEGYADNTFRAENPLTLGEGVMMLYNGYNIWFR